jgi:hypothetical protein
MMIRRRRWTVMIWNSLQQKTYVQYMSICSTVQLQKCKGVAYVEATEAAASVKNICKKKNIKTIKFYFHVLNKGTINKLTDRGSA